MKRACEPEKHLPTARRISALSGVRQRLRHRPPTASSLDIALAMLGGGRERKEDKDRSRVGLEFHKRIGDRVKKFFWRPRSPIHSQYDAKLAEAKKAASRTVITSAREAPREKEASCAPG